MDYKRAACFLTGDTVFDLSSELSDKEGALQLELFAVILRPGSQAWIVVEIEIILNVVGVETIFEDASFVWALRYHQIWILRDLPSED